MSEKAVAYFIQLHDYEEGLGVAAYTDKDAAIADRNARGENASITKVTLNPAAPPTVTWVVWPLGGGTLAASWTSGENIGVHDWLYGDKCAVVEALCAEEAIALGKMMLEDAADE
jgi:hypothetical protein